MPNTTQITELVEIDAERVDGVGSPANGTPFLMIKQLDRDTDGAPEADGLTDEQALAKALDEYGRWVKAKYTQDQIDALGKKGQAFKNPDGDYSYPIADKDDLSNAIKAVGRGGADHDAIRAYVIKRAKTLGLSDMIPDGWGSDGSLAKDTAAGADDASVPGSAAWEAEDAAALAAAGQALAQIAQMIEGSAQREQMEVATGHADDISDVCDLQDALYYVQNALGIVARVAFTEQAEGSVAKGITEDQQDQIRKTVDLLQRLDGDQTSGSAGDPERTVTMEMTKEELAELIATTVDERITKAEADRKAAEAETEAAEVAKETEATEGAETGDTAGDPAAAEVTKETGSDDIVARLGAVVKETVDAAVAPLKEQVDQMSKQAAPGGPLASASAARNGNPVIDIAGLEEKLAKSTDPVEKADLGERITKMKLFAAMTGQSLSDS